jgi:hypothetical protein
VEKFHAGRRERDHHRIIKGEERHNQSDAVIGSVPRVVDRDSCESIVT